MSEVILIAPYATTDPFFYGWRLVWQKDEAGRLVEAQRPLTVEQCCLPTRAAS